MKRSIVALLATAALAGPAAAQVSAGASMTVGSADARGPEAEQEPGPPLPNRTEWRSGGRAGRLDQREDPRDWRDRDRGDWLDGTAVLVGGGWSPDWRRDPRYDWRGWRARNRGAFRRPGYQMPPGQAYRRFAPGMEIALPLFDRRHWLLDPGEFHLPPAWGPNRWVRFYDDVLLVDIRSGRVLDLVPRFFR